MTGSHASASNSASRVLICGVNWIGDSIMSMPAIQAYRQHHPSDHLTLLVKQGLIPLWEMHEAPNQLCCLEKGWSGTRSTIARLKMESFDRAYILPHSFRSALIPFGARIPKRVGMTGHFRDAMLTEVVVPSMARGREHQAHEYMDLFNVNAGTFELPVPRLRLPDEAIVEAQALMAERSRPWIGLLPGAARGTSKRWPLDRFMATGEALVKKTGGTILILGSAAEKPDCTDLADHLGSASIDFGGSTSLSSWAALLSECDVVIANDSGGMHLAAAVEIPVVALYGITHPAQTGPLGRRHRVLQKRGARSRDVPRTSEEARARLAAIMPEEVIDATLEILQHTTS